MRLFNFYNDDLSLLNYELFSLLDRWLEGVSSRHFGYITQIFYIILFGISLLKNSNFIARL